MVMMIQGLDSQASIVWQRNAPTPWPQPLRPTSSPLLPPRLHLWEEEHGRVHPSSTPPLTP